MRPCITVGLTVENHHTALGRVCPVPSFPPLCVSSKDNPWAQSSWLHPSTRLSYPLRGSGRDAEPRRFIVKVKKQQKIPPRYKPLKKVAEINTWHIRCQNAMYLTPPMWHLEHNINIIKAKGQKHTIYTQKCHVWYNHNPLKVLVTDVELLVVDKYSKWVR